jgi:hypothetical protein
MTKMHRIEIDDSVWSCLQRHAEPFVDTPNTVLKRLLFGERSMADAEEPAARIPTLNISGLPKSLSQIFEVLYEIEVNGLSRVKATNRVAERRGTAPRKVTDKYCRQLGKRAHEIDALLTESGLPELKELLKAKFADYTGVIDMYFETMLMEA